MKKNNYLELYTKYKYKYLNLKNELWGGNKYVFTVDGDNIEILNELTFIYFDDNKKLSAVRDKVNESVVQNLEENVEFENANIKLLFDNTRIYEFNVFNIKDFRPKYILECLYKKKNSKILLTDEYKLFIINVKTEYIFKVYILIKRANLVKPGYVAMETPEYDNLYIEINKDGKNISYSGNIFIEDGKSPKVWNITVLKIVNMISGDTLNYKVDGINSLDVFIPKEFNFQMSYDNVKLNNYCKSSTIIYKHIYNTFYTSEIIKNPELFFTLIKEYGGIVEHVLNNYVIQNKDNITLICGNETFRQELLLTTPKRINSIYTEGIKLSRIGASRFIEISDLSVSNSIEFKVIFDTGNETVTIIGKKFAEALELTKKKTFVNNTSGVVQNANLKLNDYVELELKFDNSLTNIYIDKTYKIRAYIGSDDDTLLLGHGNNILTDLFDKSYCIGYNTDKIKYTEKYNVSMNIIKNYETNIAKIETNITSNNYDEIEKIISNMEDTPINNAIAYINTDAMYRVIDQLFVKSLRIREYIESKVKNGNIQVSKLNLFDSKIILK
jgi:hypothetical protein